MKLTVYSPPSIQTSNSICLLYYQRLFTSSSLYQLIYQFLIVQLHMENYDATLIEMICYFIRILCDYDDIIGITSIPDISSRITCNRIMRNRDNW